jgi:predicted amidohydrolase YtcJ
LRYTALGLFRTVHWLGRTVSLVLMRPSKQRNLLGAAMLASTLAVLPAQECREIVLYNGRIATMDQQGPLASSVTIQGDRITAVGAARGIPKHHAGATLIDLQGRRVVPGLIDAYDHIVEVSLRPGHDVRIEAAASVAEVQRLIRDKAQTVAPGEWITAVGGWSPGQFVEKRMPTQAELDAATAHNPVYVQTGIKGPAATNSEGKAFFEGRGIQVGADGSIAQNGPALAALNALRSIQTFADQMRGALDVMKYAASLGLTTSDDKGGAWPADTPGARGLAKTGDGGAVEVNPFTGYDPFLALDFQGKMLVRLRIFFYMQDLDLSLPFLKARLNNQFPDFGNEWLKISGVGERIYSGAFPYNPDASADVYEAAARLVAQKGWAYAQHTEGIEDEKKFTDVWEQINGQIPLAPLHWALGRVPGIDLATVDRLKAMGVGVTAAGSRYTASMPPRTAPKYIPPFRMLVESGIHVGYGSDGGTVSPLDPWLHMSYMVTGKNNAGERVVAPGQTLTRLQALQMYTSDQPWFTKEEHQLGSIEVGKLADLVVLSDDFLNPSRVPDDAIKRITSVLTIVGGKIVYNSGVLKAPSAVRN